jgi:GNAT superfamily N-acetyltransferase
MEMPLVATVRPLDGEDWETLRGLRVRALSDSPNAFLSPSGDEPAWPAEKWRRLADQGAWFGAFVDGVPIGLASVVYDEPTLDRFVESMWVEPHFRGRGVASALFGAVERYVAERGGSVLRLWVLEGNVSAATAYTRYGFQPTGLRQQVPGHPGMDEEEFIIEVPSRQQNEAQSTIRGTTMQAPPIGTGSLTDRRISTRTP